MDRIRINSFTAVALTMVSFSNGSLHFGLKSSANNNQILVVSNGYN